MPNDGPSDGSRRHSIGLLADVIERVGQGRPWSWVLPSPAGVGVIGGDQDQLAVRLILQRFDVVHRHLGLVVAIGFEIFGADAELFLGNVEDQPLLAACEISISDLGD